MDEVYGQPGSFMENRCRKFTLFWDTMRGKEVGEFDTHMTYWRLEAQRKMASYLPNKLVQMDGRTGGGEIIKWQTLLRTVKDRKVVENHDKPHSKGTQDIKE